MRNAHMEQTFIDLHTSESDALFRYCFFRVSDRELAIDLVQETFAKLWDQCLKDEQGIRNLRALLFKIASNLIIDWYRKKKAISLDALLAADMTESMLNLSVDGHTHMEMEAEARTVLEHIKKLEPSYQRIVYLRLVEDMQPREIAKIVGLSPNVVSVRIHRGIEELRKTYDTA